MALHYPDAAEEYEKLLRWQADILGGKPKPTDLSEGDSEKYDAFKRSLDAMGRLGYVVDVPAD